MELGDIHNLSYQDLARFTDNFSESNYLCHFQFGKLYRGKIVHAESTLFVMVKIWEDSQIYCYKPGDNESRILDEVILLRHHLVIDHPNMIKLYGFCYEVGRLGVVYDFNPFDSVYNLVLKDDFTWLQRINVLVRFASLLSFLHTIKSPYRPLTVRNLDCAHIVLDKDYNPKLCDFGLVTGGIFPDRAKYKCCHVIGSYGYLDIGSWFEDHAPDKPDVFAFGNILLSLISKRVFTEQDRQNLSPYVFKWAYTKFLEYKYGPDSDSEKDDSDRDSSKKHDSDLDLKNDDSNSDSLKKDDSDRDSKNDDSNSDSSKKDDSDRDSKNDDSDSDSKKPKFSLVHQSLVEEPDFDPSDGPKITALGMDCTHDDLGKRPTMKQVLSFLLNLEVVKKHATISLV
ncbi:hypothetical protein ABFS82_14G178200 [Erythranthe guttata]